MSQQNYEFLRTFFKEQSGLVLSADKGYLIESRLMPVARKRGLSTIDELTAAIRSGKDEGLRIDAVEAMTTNESFFFRDIKPFESLCEVVLPTIVEARKARGGAVRIWSAACSSGQEPYTIAMLLTENPGLLQGLKAEIVATDLSAEIITKAKAGLYSQFEAQRGLPIQFLMKYFEQVDEHWQIKPEIRQMVSYQQINLLHDLSRLGRFDIVFCRNVLIYFDPATKAEVLARISRMMPPDGVLYLGGAESVLGITEAFKPMQGVRGVYTIADSAEGSPTITTLPGAGASPGIAKSA